MTFYPMYRPPGHDSRSSVSPSIDIYYLVKLSGSGPGALSNLRPLSSSTLSELFRKSRSQGGHHGHCWLV